MVKIIVHRVNKVKEYNNLTNFFGVETDIRDYGKKIVLSHDPNKQGEDFFKFVRKVNKTIFLNIKSSGLLKKIINFIKKKKIYLLDISFSEFDYLYKQKLSNKILLRFSSYEKFDLKNKYFKKIEWIWYDYFHGLKITKNEYLYLKKYKKKICLVSPDLLGKKREILRYINHLNQNKIKIDAVCTKENNIKLWKDNYNY